MPIRHLVLMNQTQPNQRRKRVDGKMALFFWGAWAGGSKATDPKGSEQMLLEGLTKLLSECKAVQRLENARPSPQTTLRDEGWTKASRKTRKPKKDFMKIDHKMTATNLGLRGDANNVKDVYKWSAAGIPQSWQPGTLKTWLEQGKWTNVQYVIAPQTARGRWMFAAKPPNGHISTSLRICALDDTTVTIARWARGRPQYTEQKMKGFNRWLHAPSSRNSCHYS
jgi:hypothetical protein